MISSDKSVEGKLTIKEDCFKGSTGWFANVLSGHGKVYFFTRTKRCQLMLQV